MIKKFLKKNKKATFFGVGLVIMTFVLLVLTIWLFTLSNQKIKDSVGTDELDSLNREIDRTKFYFKDSLRLSLDETVSDMAAQAFVEAAGCTFYADSDTVIFKESCKPSSESINQNIKNKVQEKMTAFLDKYPFPVEPDVSCEISSFVECKSSDILFRNSRKSEFFRYDVYYSQKLDERIDTKIDVDEISWLYDSINQKKSCDEISCYPALNKWSIKEIIEANNYLIFTLESKEKFSGKNLELKFAIEK